MIYPGGLQHPGRAVLKGVPEDQRQEDSRNGLLLVPGGGIAVGGGIWETDDGRRAFLPVEA